MTLRAIPNACTRAVLVALATGVIASPATVLAQSATLRGTVVSTDSARPVVSATVAVPAAARQTRTDSLGRFVIDGLRAGSQELTVQAVGYSPAIARVTLPSSAPLELDVELEPLATELARVVTVAPRDAARNLAYAEFEQRRAMGLGRFLTREQLVREQGRSLSALLREKVPGLRIWDIRGAQVAGSARGNISIVPRGDSRCLVQVIVDNVIRYRTGGNLPQFDLRSLDPAMVAGIEYYTPSSTPAEFNRGSSAACGTLLIWLQN